MKTLDAFNDIKLCAYVYVSSVYENGKNIFQSFEPLIETALETFDTAKSISFIEFQNRVNDLYKVRIPKATLLKLLEELDKGGKIRFVRKNLIYVVTDCNAELLHIKQCRAQEITNLFFSFREYILKKNKEISYDDAKKIICKYLFSHCFDLIDFIGGNTRPKQFDDEDDVICELCDFLFENRERNSEQYKAFLNLYNGAVQSTLLNFNPDKIDQIQDERLMIDEVILDTNFVMRLLDIQTENEYVMAKETYDSLKEMKVRFVVLKDTLLEIVKSIRSYLNESQPYTADTRQYYQNIPIRASGLLSAAQRGKSRTEFLAYSNYSKLKLIMESKFGVCVIEDFEPPKSLKEETISLIRSKNRDGYGPIQAEHDLLLIAYCNIQRGALVNSFNDAKCWVVTNDIKLTFWNQQNCPNIQECMTETQLSNLLWLMARKEDNLGLANTMIAIANSEMINQNTFYKFASKMKTYRDDIKDDPEKVNRLALVFASDSITEEDIKHISKSEQNIDELIRIKADDIQREKAKFDETLSHQIEENTDLNYQLGVVKKELQISNLKNEISNLKNEIMSCEEIKSVKSTENENLQQEQLKLRNSHNYFPKAVREVAGRLLFASLLLIAIFYALYFAFRLQIIERLSFLQTVPEWQITMLSIIIPPVLYLLVCFLILLVTGKLIKPGEIIVFLTNKRVEKYMKKNNIECCVDQIDERVKQVDEKLEENKQNIIEQTEQIQNMQNLISKKEKEILNLKPTD